ncbi:MAG TPA: diguanylate cyclase [Nitrosospira sp.]|nr:diguanylate cyclase [Nitrosospira sp.]
MLNDPVVLILMYFILPLWLAAGFADWLCHRASHIETTSGAKESVFHLIMLAEMGLPLLAAIFLQVNAGIIALMIAAFFLHEITALWDVSYAVTVRRISPIEQHVHSFQEMIPLMAILLLISRHWGQFQALFGFGPETPQFDLAWKKEQLPVTYVISIMTVALLLEVIPFVEEFFRGLRANHGALVPLKARTDNDEGHR